VDRVRIPVSNARWRRMGRINPRRTRRTLMLPPTSAVDSEKTSLIFALAMAPPRLSCLWHLVCACKRQRRAVSPNEQHHHHHLLTSSFDNKSMRRGRIYRLCRLLDIEFVSRSCTKTQTLFIKGSVELDRARAGDCEDEQT